MVLSEGQVVLTDRGGADPVRITVSGVQCNWEVSRAGALSCLVAETELRELGTTIDVGNWLRYDHPTAGSWGGIVTSTRPITGSVEIGAESFHVLFRKRRAPVSARLTTASSGGHVKRLLDTLSKENPTWLTKKTIRQGGILFPASWNGEDVYDQVLPSIAALGDSEWDVDADRVFIWDSRIGTDLSSSVALRESLQITGDTTLTEDLWTVENAIIGRSADGKRSFEQVDTASILTHGRLEATHTYSDTTGSIATKQRAKSDVAEKKDPALTPDVSIVDRDGSFAAFRHGDSVTLVLPSANAIVVYRVMARGVDVQGGVMKLTGYVERRVT